MIRRRFFFQTDEKRTAKAKSFCGGYILKLLHSFNGAVDWTMFSIARTSRLTQQPTAQVARRNMSILEGDIGKMGTSVHHKLNQGLAVFTPLYFLTPDSYTDGTISKAFGLLLSVSITAHSWIGLNYVCRDYVPKISTKLLGPARVATMGLSVITLLGMAKISVMSPGGLKGVVKGVWNGSPIEKKIEY
jgi:hypothetical protein